MSIINIREKTTINQEKGIANSCCFLVGYYLLIIQFFILLITNIFYMANKSIGYINIVLAVLFSISTVYLVTGRSLKKTGIVILVGSLILCACTAVNLVVFDFSFDGNSYHKDLTGSLKMGWVPTNETYYSFIARNMPYITDVGVWYDTYPKASEIWAANVYYATENIECGKSFNLLSMICTILIAYSTLSQLINKKKIAKAIASILLALNPVSLVQLFTYYNDAYMWQMVTICLIMCVFLTYRKNKNDIIVAFPVLYIVINIALNIKVSAAIFLGLPCICFFCYWMCKYIIRKENSLQFIRMSFLTFAVSLISGLLLCGYSTYVVNFFRHSNPFYPMIGNGSIDIMSYNTPIAFRPLSNIQKFIASVFSRTSNDLSISAIQWKLPFDVIKSELEWMKHIDTRIAGWGVLFSGIILISGIVIVAEMIRSKGHIRKIKEIIVVLLVMFSIMIVLIPGLWWARYAVFMFYLPVCAVVLIIVQRRTYYKIAMVIILTSLCILNMYPTGVTLVENARATKNIISDLQVFKGEAEERDYAVCFGEDFQFYGRTFTLMDYQLDCNFDKTVIRNYDGIISQYKIPIYYKYSDQ